jgi:Nucleotide modification associated domain 2
MNMRIRAYTLTVHAGHAPCWMFDPQRGREVLSVANCKPLIRHAADVGEWVAGVTTKAMGCRLTLPNAVSGLAGTIHSTLPTDCGSYRAPDRRVKENDATGWNSPRIRISVSLSTTGGSPDFRTYTLSME